MQKVHSKVERSPMTSRDQSTMKKVGTVDWTL